jgi:CCR4-NOT transcription complex subunit 1
LAGALALVTCKEPLKLSLTNNLKKKLQSLQPRPNESISATEIADISSTASKENLELGCKRIKEAVVEKALKKVREDQ